jgi:hypothetical protein
VKPSHAIRPVFDDPNLVSAAGLVPALRLAESAGLHDLLDAGLSLVFAERDGEDDQRGRWHARRRGLHR